MSLFGSLLGDGYEDDPVFGAHFRTMRNMNNMMNSLLGGDPFGGMGMGMGMGMQPPMLGGVHALQGPMGGHQMMPFGFPQMPNIGQMMSLTDMPGAATSFSSSRVVSMTQGPDGRPQVYEATSKVKTGPDGLRETQNTVQDSRTGVRKMAIGHHIGERGHVIEREKNYYNGDEEERQDFINLDEDEADDFNREFLQKSRSMSSIGSNSHNRRAIELPALPSPTPRRNLLALPAPPETSTSTTGSSRPSTGVSSSTSASPSITAHSTARRIANRLATPRRGLRTTQSSPLTLSSSSSPHNSFSSVHPHPYHAVSSRRNHRPMKGAPSTHSPNNNAK